VICTYRCRRLSLFFVFGSACAARRGCDSRSVDGGLPSPPPPSLSLTSLVSQCAARALRSLSSPVPKSVARSVVRRVSFLPLCGCGAGGRGIGALPDCCRTRVPPFVTCAHCTARAAAQCGWPEGSLSTASLLTLLVCRGSDRVRARLVWRCTAVPLACTLTHIRVSSHPLPPSSLIHSKRLRTSALNIAPLFFFFYCCVLFLVFEPVSISVKSIVQASLLLSYEYLTAYDNTAQTRSATTAVWFLRCATSSGVSFCQPRIDLSAPCCSSFATTSSALAHK